MDCDQSGFVRLALYYLASDTHVHFFSGVWNRHGDYRTIDELLYGTTMAPTPELTANPTNAPTEDTLHPTNDPTGVPTQDPAGDPTSDPTLDPTSSPSHEPTAESTVGPTIEPTGAPTRSFVVTSVVDESSTAVAQDDQGDGVVSTTRVPLRRVVLVIVMVGAVRF